MPQTKYALSGIPDFILDRGYTGSSEGRESRTSVETATGFKVGDFLDNTVNTAAGRAPFSDPANTSGVAGVVVAVPADTGSTNQTITYMRNVKIDLSKCQALPNMTNTQFNALMDRLQILDIQTGFESNSVIGDPRIDDTVRNHQNEAGTWDQASKSIGPVHQEDAANTFKYDTP